MNFRVAILAVVAGCLAGCSHLATPTLTADGSDLGLSQQILVTTKQITTGAQGLVGDPATLYLRRPGYGPTTRVNRVLDDIAGEFDIVRVEGWMISSLGVYCEVYAVPAGRDIEEVLQLVANDPRVESAQRMVVFETQAVIYNDPYAPMQPALNQLSLASAHELATGRGVTVAVIDSSVDDRHPEIKGRVSLQRDLVSDRRRAGNAEIHGTAIAGIIASTANNGQGIVGVAPEARVVSLRACWTIDGVTGRARCSSFSLARSIEEAIRIGVDVINMSLSGPSDPLLERLVDAAVDAGIVVVAAVPEVDGGDAGFPASHSGVIAVESMGLVRPFNREVLVAPGREVISTVPGSDYAFFSGNSMASAFVAGVSALLIERRPGIRVDEVFKVLTETSTPDSINACRAVAAFASTGGCQFAVNQSLSLGLAD